EPNFTIKNTCQGNRSLLTSTSVLNATSGNLYWDIGNNSSIEYSNSNFITQIFESNSTNVELKITNTYNCSDSIVKTIQLFPNPVAEFLAGDVNCPGDTITFTNQASCLVQDSAKYFWKFGDLNQNTAINPSHVYKKYGDFNVSLVAIDENNCADTVEKTVNVPQKETVSISYEKDTLYEKESVILEASSGFASYDWSTSETTSTIVVSLTDSYSVIAYDSEGCISFDTVNIVAFAEFNPDEIIAINNILTPYNDGVNDNLEFYDLETYGKCQLTIFNQWGFEIIKIDDYQNDWKGTDKNGDYLRTGTYFYVIQSDNIISKGSINIIR
ncbi:gliding motility-associated C-terminal domain-containing protein, partial [Bacteroidota bacterium]